jgi:hypothetical protein
MFAGSTHGLSADYVGSAVDVGDEANGLSAGLYTSACFC